MSKLLSNTAFHVTPIYSLADLLTVKWHISRYAGLEYFGLKLTVALVRVSRRFELSRLATVVSAEYFQLSTTYYTERLRFITWCQSCFKTPHFTLPPFIVSRIYWLWNGISVDTLNWNILVWKCRFWFELASVSSYLDWLLYLINENLGDWIIWYQNCLKTHVASISIADLLTVEWHIILSAH